MDFTTASASDYMYASICATIFMLFVLSAFLIVYYVSWGEVAEFFIRWYVHLFVHISRRAKCPACGSRRKHPIQFSTAHKAGENNVAGAILHQCVTCQAAFAERTLVDPDKWLIKQPAINPDEAAAVPGNFPFMGGASRAPITPGTQRTTTVMRDQSSPTVVG